MACIYFVLHIFCVAYIFVMYGQPKVLNIYFKLHIFFALHIIDYFTEYVFWCGIYFLLHIIFRIENLSLHITLLNMFSGVEYIFYVAYIFRIGHFALHIMYGKPKVLNIFSTLHIMFVLHIFYIEYILCITYILPCKYCAR